jgi:hypothetical protein
LSSGFEEFRRRLVSLRLVVSCPSGTCHSDEAAWDENRMIGNDDKADGKKLHWITVD